MSTPPPSIPALGSVQPPDPRALQLLHEAEISGDLNCHQVGTVQSFNAANQTATIGINMTRQIAGIAVKYPVLVTCPLFVLRGGLASITMPIAAGDECLVLFNDRDIDNWWQSGQTNLVPNTPRVHALSDGIALVGVRSLPNADPAYSSNRAQFKMGGALVDVYSDGSGGDVVTISISGGTTQIQMAAGSPASGRISMTANSASIKTITDAFLSAVIGIITTGGQSLSAGSIAALNAVKTSFDNFYS